MRTNDMRRTSVGRIARLASAVLLAVVLLPQAVMAASPAAPAAATIPVVKLTCSLSVPNPLDPAAPNRANVCKWVAPVSVTVTTYRVWRSVDARARVLIGTVAPTDPLRYADRNIATGHTYHYFVTGVADTGVRVVKTNVSNVYVVRAPQTLAFSCQLATATVALDVRCRWTATTRPAAVRYVLWRSVDGAARTAVYRTGIHGRRTFLDAAVASGQSIRYAVVGLDARGRIVAYGSPVTVLIP
jgi:hypothetical protein